jgi:hypothetical protein
VRVATLGYRISALQAETGKQGASLLPQKKSPDAVGHCRRGEGDTVPAKIIDFHQHAPSDGEMVAALQEQVWHGTAAAILGFTA